MAITVNEPDYLSSFYVPLFNPILFTFTATAAETKVLIQVKDSAGAILQDNIILLFDSSNVVVFDAAPYLKPQNSNDLEGGQYITDINDTNSIVEFYLSWDEYPQASPTTFEDSNTFYAVSSALQIGNTVGNNLYNQISISPKAGVFLTDFTKVKHWEGYPQSIGWINSEGGVKEILTASGARTVTAYSSTFNNVFELILPDKGENYDIDVLNGIVFYTEWNVSTGNFTAAATLSSGTTMWVLPDQTEVEINSLNTSNASIDGNLNPIVIIGDVKSLEIRNKKCSGTLDLRRFNLTGNLLLDEVTTYGFNPILFSSSNSIPQINISNNANLTSLDFTGTTITATAVIKTNTALTELIFNSTGNTFSAIDFQGNTALLSLSLVGWTPLSSVATINLSTVSALTSFTQPSTVITIASFTLRFADITTLDISNITSDFIQADQQSLMTSVTLTSTAKSIGTILLNDCALNTINQGGLIYDSTLSSLNFEDNSMTAGQVDTIVLDADTRALGGSSGTMRFGGTNAAPTGGGANVNIVSLTVKGFTVIHT